MKNKKFNYNHNNYKNSKITQNKKVRICGMKK